MVQHGEALGRESGDHTLQEAIAHGALDALEPRMAAVCRYALKLTLDPAAMIEADVDALRHVGLDDRGIVDANQVASYFNYVNRVVDGLGVELEEAWPADVRTKRRYDLARRAEDP